MCVCVNRLTFKGPVLYYQTWNIIYMCVCVCVCCRLPLLLPPVGPREAGGGPVLGVGRHPPEDRGAQHAAGHHRAAGERPAARGGRGGRGGWSQHPTPVCVCVCPGGQPAAGAAGREGGRRPGGGGAPGGGAAGSGDHGLQVRGALHVAMETHHQLVE